MASLTAPYFNFFLLIFLLVYKLYKPTRSYVYDRQKTIRDSLQSVRQQLNLAQEKYEEFSSKLQAIDAEIISLREQTRQDSLALKQKVQIETRRLTQTILADAARSAETLYLDFKNEVRAEFGLRVLDQAERLLGQQITAEDRERLRVQFSAQVESNRV